MILGLFDVVVGLAGALVGVLVGALVGALVGMLVSGLRFGLAIGLTFGLVYWLHFSFAGLRIHMAGMQEAATEGFMQHLNEEIRQPIKNGPLRKLLLGLGFGLGAGLGVGLIFGLIFRLIFGLGVGLRVGLGTGLVAGLTAGLTYGWDDLVHHYILRFWLWRTHTFPWKAESFLEARYEEGEDWLKPLLDFRELLQSTIDPARKLEFREVRQRRTNRINLTRRGEISPRSYSLETRRMLLRRLLEAKVQVQREGPDPDLELISLEELREIRRIWITEDGDWGDSLPAIYREVIGGEVSWDLSLLPFRRQSGLVKQHLEAAAALHDLPPALLLQLLQAEHEHGEAEGVLRALDAILSKDWRAPEEVVEALKAERAHEPAVRQQDLW